VAKQADLSLIVRVGVCSMGVKVAAFGSSPPPSWLASDPSALK
jgi:hypothetical protein